MRVGQEPLGHAHRQIGDAGLLDEGADIGVGLRIGGALAEDDQRPLGALQHLERSRNRLRRRNLARRRVDDLDQRLGALLRVDRLAEKFSRQVKIDATRTTGAGRANGARHADADVLGMQHAEGRLAERLGDGKLVHLLVVALLKVDDLALGRAADHDHRKAVGRGIGERGQAVEEARSRHRQANAGLLRQEAGDRSRIACVLFVPERDDAHTCSLGEAPQIRDRNARHTVDRVDVVELERIDDKVKAVRQRVLCVGFVSGARRGYCRCSRHSILPCIPLLCLIGFG